MSDIPASGSVVDMGTLHAVFGGSRAAGPVAMDKFWGASNGVTAHVPGIPTSGPISFADFRGKSIPHAHQVLPAASPSTVVCALSTRLLDPSYSGFAVSIRRASDDAVKDFYVDKFGNAHDGSGTSVAAWLGGGADTGFVTTWYDQSGNGRHAAQAAPSLQPTVTLIGDGKIRVTFSSTASYLDPHISLLSTATLPLTAQYVVEFDADGTLFMRGTAGGGCQYEPWMTTSSVAVSGCGGSGRYSTYSPLAGRTDVLFTQPGAGGTTEPRSTWFNGAYVTATNQGRGQGVNTSVWNIVLGGISGSSGRTKTPGLSGHMDTFVAYNPTQSGVEQVLKYLWSLPDRG